MTPPPHVNTPLRAADGRAAIAASAPIPDLLLTLHGPHPQPATLSCSLSTAPSCCRLKHTARTGRRDPASERPGRATRAEQQRCGRAKAMAPRRVSRRLRVGRAAGSGPHTLRAGAHHEPVRPVRRPPILQGVRDSESALLGSARVGPAGPRPSTRDRVRFPCPSPVRPALPGTADHGPGRAAGFEEWRPRGGSVRVIPATRTTRLSEKS